MISIVIELLSMNIIQGNNIILFKNVMLYLFNHHHLINMYNEMIVKKKQNIECNIIKFCDLSDVLHI